MNLNAIDDKITIPAVLAASINSDFIDHGERLFSAPDIDLEMYDRIIVSMSGGKDSIAALLRLIEMGVQLEKVELWHNLVDGNEGDLFMDWKFMDSYNQQLAKAFKIPLYNSWLKHGFRGEMLKNNSISHEYIVETPTGNIIIPRPKAKAGTRLRFPQQGNDLSTRWCSSALKIEVGRRALSNQQRFNGSKILFITGERREESSNRAKYYQLEKHFCDNRFGKKERWVDAWRPVLEFSEREVWEIMERHNVAPPVPYRLGWSRSSCMTCIYNSPAIWSTIQEYFPERSKPIYDYENEFGCTVSRQKINVLNLASKADPIDIQDLEALKQARLSDYILPVFTSNWVLPIGAFGKEGCGST